MEDKTWRDVIREERKKLAQLTWGQRLVYIWDYYKPLMVAVLVIIFAVSTGISIYHNMQLKDVLQVYFLNSNGLEADAEGMTAEFAEYLGGLDKNEVLTLDTGIALGGEDSTAYAYQIKFMALMTNADIDILVMDPERFEEYQKEGYFCDLGEVLSQEQMSRWADGLVYADDPENGGEKAYGLRVQEAPALQRYHIYEGGILYAAVTSNAKHTDVCDDFFEYLMKP